VHAVGNAISTTHACRGLKAIATEQCFSEVELIKFSLQHIVGRSDLVHGYAHSDTEQSRIYYIVCVCVLLIHTQNVALFIISNIINIIISVFSLCQPVCFLAPAIHSIISLVCYYFDNCVYWFVQINTMQYNYTCSSIFEANKRTTIWDTERDWVMSF